MFLLWVGEREGGGGCSSVRSIGPFGLALSLLLRKKTTVVNGDASNSVFMITRIFSLGRGTLPICLSFKFNLKGCELLYSISVRWGKFGGNSNSEEKGGRELIHTAQQSKMPLN